MDELTLIATTTFGLEAVAARELGELGYDATIPGNGRVVFRGDASALCRANLWLRSADRVLVQLASFQAPDFDALFEGVQAVPWERWIPADGAFPVRGRSVRSTLSSVPAIQRTVKKGIVQRLQLAHGADMLPETGPEVRVEVSLLNDRAIIALDTTGPGLNKRGYRPVAGKAALKETLAAALVLLSFWKPDRPLWDPFCGTGTIPIEAAMIGRNIAPGLHRAFAAEAWAAIGPEPFARARDDAHRRIVDALPETIVGTDLHPGALSLARDNARRAGVEADIHFQQQDFRELTSSREHGCVITNPPYGLRMGQRGELDALYRAMPDVFRRLATWSIYVLTAREDMEHLVGRGADRRRKLYNGRIECTYYQFHGPRPGQRVATPRQVAKGRDPEPAAEPAFGGLDAKAVEQAEVFANRLAKMARHRRRWPKRGITCYRLYDRDVPEVPLAVDVYEGRLHLAEYDRPHDRTPAQHGDWLDLMVAKAAEVLDVPREEVFLKRRRRQRGPSQYDRFDEAGRTFVVSEGGLRFEVNLSDYLDTGLFLDHRLTRAMVRDESAGKRFCNLFAYTGSFTAYAADGGATATTSVDLSNTYIEWARRNLSLNGFDGPEHRLIRADVPSFVRTHPPGEHYDLAVVDPPTFSNSKMTAGDWDVQAGHGELLARLLALMPPGGAVYFSCNYRRFKLDEASIPAREIREISKQTVPDDFRNERIHRCWRIVK